MLKNAYLVVKIGADTAENEHMLADILTKFQTTGPKRGRVGPCARDGDRAARSPPRRPSDLQPGRLRAPRRGQGEAGHYVYSNPKLEWIFFNFLLL